VGGVDGMVVVMLFQSIIYNSVMRCWGGCIIYSQIYSYKRRTHHFMLSLAYKSMYSSTAIASNLPLSIPNATNSLTFSSVKCGPKCLSYLFIISGFASSLLCLWPRGASTTVSCSTSPLCRVTVRALGMERVEGSW